MGMEEIPHDLGINWDQTGIHYVPVGSWTMEKEGAKRVEITAIDDKRQITAVFAGSLSGDFLPPQLIYKGKTRCCLPTIEFLTGWHITNSPNGQGLVTAATRKQHLQSHGSANCTDILQPLDVSVNKAAMSEWT